MGMSIRKKLTLIVMPIPLMIPSAAQTTTPMMMFTQDRDQQQHQQQQQQKQKQSKEIEPPSIYKDLNKRFPLLESIHQALFTPQSHHTVVKAFNPPAPPPTLANRQHESKKQDLLALAPLLVQRKRKRKGALDGSYVPVDAQSSSIVVEEEVAVFAGDDLDSAPADIEAAFYDEDDEDAEDPSSNVEPLSYLDDQAIQAVTLLTHEDDAISAASSNDSDTQLDNRDISLHVPGVAYAGDDVWTYLHAVEQDIYMATYTTCMPLQAEEAESAIAGTAIEDTSSIPTEPPTKDVPTEENTQIETQSAIDTLQEIEPTQAQTFAHAHALQAIESHWNPNAPFYTSYGWWAGVEGPNANKRYLQSKKALGLITPEERPRKWIRTDHEPPLESTPNPFPIPHSPPPPLPSDEEDIEYDMLVPKDIIYPESELTPAEIEIQRFSIAYRAELAARKQKELESEKLEMEALKRQEMVARFEKEREKTFAYKKEVYEGFYGKGAGAYKVIQLESALQEAFERNGGEGWNGDLTSLEEVGGHGLKKMDVAEKEKKSRGKKNKKKKENGSMVDSGHSDFRPNTATLMIVDEPAEPINGPVISEAVGKDSKDEREDGEIDDKEEGEIDEMVVTSPKKEGEKQRRVLWPVLPIRM
ncbi:hypothetical protein HDV05_002700 [Chytridiales sp. JEL 0842]|nr:hypothetical protein HDV05_002700 [Chytridiales sp. JEL 0842]